MYLLSMYYLSAFGSFDCMWVLSGQIRIEEHNKAKSSIMISYLINLRVYSILYLYPSWPFRQFKCSFHIFQSFVNSKIHTGHFYYLPKFLVWSPFSSMRPHFHAGGADCQDGVILSSCHPVMLTVLDTGNFSKLTDTCFYAVCGENYNGFFHMTKHISNMIQEISGKSEKPQLPAVARCPGGHNNNVSAELCSELPRLNRFLDANLGQL